jgi:hypothetical protein
MGMIGARVSVDDSGPRAASAPEAEEPATGPGPAAPPGSTFPPAGEDDLFRDPFADFLPSRR